MATVKGFHAHTLTSSYDPPARMPWLHLSPSPKHSVSKQLGRLLKSVCSALIESKINGWSKMATEALGLGSGTGSGAPKPRPKHPPPDAGPYYLTHDPVDS